LTEEAFAVIRDRYELAAMVHPALIVELSSFVNHLMHISLRCLGNESSEASLVAFLTSLHTNDLLLALSCAEGSDGAWKSFYASYGKCLSDLSRHFLGRTPGSEELGETIWVDLFLPDKSGQSRIASYDGRSSLATWLRVVVINRVINERQRLSFLPANIEIIPEPKDPLALHHVESRVRLERYQDIALGAFRQAIGKLSDQEARMMFLRYDQELQLGQIARVFSVHQCTITRQIERLVQRLRADVVALLASHYGLNSAQIEECMGVASETFATSVSIFTLVRERAGVGNCPQPGLLRIDAPEPVSSLLRRKSASFECL